MIFTTDGPRSRHECRWLRIFCKKKCFFVFSLERRSSRREEPGRGSFRILKSQCPCIFAVENNPIPLTFENLSLAQLAVGVGQARRLRLPCEHIEQILKYQCPGIFHCTRTPSWLYLDFWESRLWGDSFFRGAQSLPRTSSPVCRKARYCVKRDLACSQKRPSIAEKEKCSRGTYI